MAQPVTTDPAALAALIRGLGGHVIAGPVFTFDLPLEKVREVIPRINDLGIGVEKVSERIEDNPTKNFSPQTIATLKLVHRR
jgi:hypothetical protein